MDKRFEYIRGKYKHYIHDAKKDGKHIKGKIGTYGVYDLDEITDILNDYEKQITKLHEENEQLKQENKKLKEDLEHCANQFTNDGKNVLLNLM